jgi:hypothetical protein
MHYDDHHDLILHQDDHWLDTILLHGEDGPLLRLMTKYRYKTSDLSGDQWRTSTMWQCTESLAAHWQGDTRQPTSVLQGRGTWVECDGPYWGKLDTGCAALYPGLYTSQSALHAQAIVSVDFCRKGILLYRATYDGDALSLIVVAGHLPWALIDAQDNHLESRNAWAGMQFQCFQPGCSEKATSTYQLKNTYNSEGTPSLAESQRYFPDRKTVGLIRRFCPLHLRRGDGGLEDADDNYTTISGPGPSEAQGWEAYESAAMFGGFVPSC